MRRVVLKFSIPAHRGPPDLVDEQGRQRWVGGAIPVTVGATVVLVDQHAFPSIWVEMDPDAPPVDWYLIVVATGDAGTILPGDVHLGSFVTRDASPIVWHVYRRP